MARKPKTKQRGQLKLDGTIDRIDELVSAPFNITVDSLTVVSLVHPESERDTVGYLDAQMEKAKRLAGVSTSVGAGPWMNSRWQAKKRMEKSVDLYY